MRQLEVLYRFRQADTYSSARLLLPSAPLHITAIMNRLFGAKNTAPKPTLQGAIGNVGPHHPTRQLLQAALFVCKASGEESVY